MANSILIRLLLVATILITSCRHMTSPVESESRIELLEERIRKLEERMDRPDKPSSTIDDLRNENISSYRCQAITKKGTRCKRIVRSGNYCWQHRR